MEFTVPSKLPNGMTGMRVAPKLRPDAYRSFEVHQPVRTHYRDATCKEVECQHYLAGWVSQLDSATPEGRRWIAAVRSSGRRFTVALAGTVHAFSFPAGQRCFQAPHKVPVGRPEIYVVRDGDWRGNPTGRVDKNVRPGEFVERMAENLDVLTSAAQQG